MRQDGGFIRVHRSRYPDLIIGINPPRFSQIHRAAPEHTMSRERAAFFSPFEQKIILETFEQYKAVITAKCNTSAAAKSRVTAWQKIAERLNAANPNNVKRTWQQVKIKYKNIVQCANRKRKQKFGEGVATPGFSPAGEVALWRIRGRPVVDAAILGLSSERIGISIGKTIATESEGSGGVIQTVPAVASCAEEPAEHSDSEHDEKNIVVCSHQEQGTEALICQEDPGTSGPSGPGDDERDEDVTALYKRYLRQEIAYRHLKMKKLEKEIQLLDKQLDVG
ncbi:GT1 domain-containing protein isoform X2 [Silurus meridionalis]|uniref:GT1 domain-containing protein isoform X1 n=1 Tax=Silurus meridionalis TaxID=175797 RepID=UPI001EEB0E08|nr:GT1 domain-containing protein isoform X1 [Silurus meridionalis]XP_046708723.1 GT1 domain-containing protein isoform X2 [Silurus meridionalis]XP_046708724.1 GT1 domain-containing protein isoform X2 [Silurus meridionalis]KAI5103745.1 hypothetical protein C0J45_5371 [Silurus meridionalis]